MRKEIIYSITLAAVLAVQAPILSFAQVKRAPATNLTDRLAQWGLDADLRLFGSNFFGGSGVRGGYRFEVEPAFHKGLISRTDKYYFNANLGNKGASSIKEVTDSDFGIGLSLRHDLEVEFVRQFKNSKEALTAKPYFYKNLPINADHVKNNLQVGDFATIKARMGLILGAEFVKALNISHLGLSVSTHYLVTGEFQVHVLKLPEDKVRLKLVGLRNKGNEHRVDVGFASVLNIVGINYIDERITKILDLNPIELRFNNGHKNMFMVDYIVDLKDLEAATAYNKVLEQTKKYESVKILNPIGKDDQVRERLVMDIAAIDGIYVRDQVNGKVSSVERSFKGSADSGYRESKIKLGTKLIRLEEGRKYSENRIVSIAADEDRDYYRLNSYKAESEGSFFFNFLKVYNQTQMNAVFSTDSNFENLSPESIVLSAERRDKRFRQGELSTVKDQLYRAVPKFIVDQIDFSKWNKEQTRIRNNVASRYQIVLHPEAIAAAPELNKKELTKRFEEYLQTIPRTNLIGGGGASPTARQEQYENRVAAMMTKIEKILNRKLSDVERVNALMELRKSSIFKRVGIGFLVSLLPQHKLHTLIRFDFDMESTDGDQIDFGFGDNRANAVYTRLLYIQSILDDDGLNLRLEGETLGLQRLGLSEKS